MLPFVFLGIILQEMGNFGTDEQFIFKIAAI